VLGPPCPLPCPPPCAGRGPDGAGRSGAAGAADATGAETAGAAGAAGATGAAGAAAGVPALGTCGAGRGGPGRGPVPGPGRGAPPGTGADGPPDDAAPSGWRGGRGRSPNPPWSRRPWPPPERPPLAELPPVKASLSLRTTGASIVEDAERTNSPISSSLAMTALLSTPNSLASSYTRTFATMLLYSAPSQGALKNRIVSRPGA
jgi:hypothetical protein